MTDETVVATSINSPDIIQCCTDAKVIYEGEVEIEIPEPQRIDVPEKEEVLACQSLGGTASRRTKWKKQANALIAVYLFITSK